MVYSVRMQCGRVLAMESPVEADIVSSVPESGTAAAHGYARQVKIIKLSSINTSQIKIKKSKILNNTNYLAVQNTFC